MIWVNHLSKPKDFLDDEEKLDKAVNIVFQAFDTDNTGYIDKTCLKQFADEQAVNLGMDKPSDDLIGTAMSNVGTNAEGQVNKTEFKKFVKELCKLANEMLEG